MSNPNETGPDGPKTDEPLHPEALAAFRKARRSFGVSIGILLVGFMALGFALVYRVTRDTPPPQLAQTIELPAGAEIVSALVSDGEINVTYTNGGITMLALFDQATGRLTRSLILKN